MWRKPLQGLVVLIPPALVAFGGFGYLRSVAKFLENPGVPIRHDLETRGGKVRIEAQGYALKGNDLVLTGGKVSGPKGDPLLTIGKARLDAGRLMSSNFGDIRADVDDVWAKIRRNRNGRLEILDLLPESKGPVPKNPFQVNLRRLSVDLVDEAGPKPFATKLSTPGIRVSGMGEEWRTEGRFAIDGVGSLRLGARQIEGRGIRLKGNAAPLQLAVVLRHIQSLLEARGQKELLELKADKLSYAGPIEASISPKGGFALRLDGQGSGSGLRFREWTAKSAQWTGTVAETGAIGRLALETDYASGAFDGVLRWDKSLAAGGVADLTVAQSSAVPDSLRKLLPEGTSFANARFKGWVGAEKSSLVAQGTVDADRLTASGQTATGLRTTFYTDGRDVVAPDLRGFLQGKSVVSSAYLRDGNLIADARIQGASASQVGQFLPEARRLLETVRFSADVRALIQGPISKPSVDLWATGSGAAQLTRERNLAIPIFDLAANWDGSVLAARRAYVHTDSGDLALTAQVDAKGRITGRTVAEVPVLAKWVPDLKGSASFEGQLSGPASNPKLAGLVRSYGVGTEQQQIPYAESRLVADRQGLRLDELKAASGTATIRGALAARFADQRIWGRLSAPGLFIQSFTEDETVRGVVNLDDLRIGGTLANPVLAGSGSADRLVVGEIFVNEGTFQFQFKDRNLTIPSLLAQVAGGSVKGSAFADLRKETLSAKVEFAHVQAGRIAGVRNLQLEAQATLDGSMQASGAFKNPSLISEGNLTDVKVRDTSFGNGFWAVKGNLDKLAGEVEVGSLERYLRLEDLSVEPKKKLYGGTVIAYRNEVADYLQAFRPSLREVSPANQRILDRLTAVLDADVAIQSTPEGWTADARTLNASKIAVGPDELGDLKMAVSRKGSRWDLPSLTFDGPAGKATISGFLDEKGDLSIDGEISQADLALANRLFPNVARMDAKADLSWLASGPTQNPDVRASLFVTRGGTGRDRLLIQLAPIEFTPAPSTLSPNYANLDVQGSIQYRNLEAMLVGKAPWSWREGFRRNEPLEAKLELSSELLKVEEVGDTGFLDPARTKGSAEGSIRIFGTLDKIETEGDITIKDADIAVRGLQTGLRDVDASLKLRSNEVLATATSASTRGGTAEASAKITLPNLADLASDFSRGNLDSLYASPIEGRIRSATFGLLQKADAFGSVSGELGTEIVISGPLRSPLLSGTVAGGNLSLDLVLQETPPGEPLTLPIDPRFDLKVTTPGGARFRTVSTEMVLSGDGALRGSLLRPEFSADLRVREGSIRLPNARIAIEERGTVRPFFRFGDPSDTVARITVDLLGRTRITASRTPGQVERYEVNLEVRGDLLAENGLVFGASSDPPGLSQDRILAIIGTGDLLESLNGGFQGGRFQQALLNVAIPAFLDRFTAGIAKGLGLDYIGVTFDQQQSATVYFVDTLLRGLTVEGSRQLREESVAGEPLRYDIKLAYRLPSRSGSLSRYRFILGRDQVTPWKIGVEYSGRFGNVLPAETSVLRVISGKRG